MRRGVGGGRAAESPRICWHVLGSLTPCRCCGRASSVARRNGAEWMLLGPSALKRAGLRPPPGRHRLGSVSTVDGVAADSGCGMAAALSRELACQQNYARSSWFNPQQSATSCSVDERVTSRIKAASRSMMTDSELSDSCRQWLARLIATNRRLEAGSHCLHAQDDIPQRFNLKSGALLILVK